MPYVFDPSKTLAVILAFPNNMVTIELLRWLDQIGVKESITVCQPNRVYGERCMTMRDACLGQNQQVVAGLARKDFDSFIFAENDIRPNLQTSSPFLEAKADVVCVEFETEMPHDYAWGSPDSFHTALWRTTRGTVEAIQPPYFLPQYNSDATALVGCTCGLMRRKLLDGGFSIVHAGLADHSPQHPCLKQQAEN